MNTVSSKTDKDGMKDPDLSRIEVKTTIKNNLITLEKTKFKVSVFRIRMEGQTSFDGRINFKMRLGLPPLGIIGIPIKATGTSDKPSVKVGRNNVDSLSSKEDVDSVETKLQ